MSAEDYYPDTWVAVSPGVLELPTTKFRIIFKHTNGSFVLTWDGGGDMVYGTLEEAKESTKRRMAELIEMGFEV